jgi:hypothetical protein
MNRHVSNEGEEYTTVHAKRRTLMVGRGLMKSVKMNMVDVLSIWI